MTPPPSDEEANERRERRRREVVRRRFAALGVIIGLGVAIGVGLARPWDDGDTKPVATSTASTTEVVATPAPAPAPAPQAAAKLLPRGGRSLLPEFRVVALFGAPQAKELGALGRGTPAEDVARLTRLAAPYRRGGRPLLPALWLIASISSKEPGTDGSYRTTQAVATIRRYLSAARKAKMLLVLDIQPGRADVVAEVRRVEPFLREPDVGLALDPEWTLGPDETAADAPGSLPVATINQVSAELARIVRANRLPEKLLAVHSFSPDLITGDAALAARPGVALVIDANAIGPLDEKRSTYAAVARPGTFRGLKLFFDEDPVLVTPDDVLSLTPQPDVVVYE
jgi:hypothetical protein